VDVVGYDKDAEFERFVADVGPRLSRLALLLSGDTHRAEELLQQTLVRVYLAWPRARDGDPVAYSRRILANQRIDTWRVRRREVLVDPIDLPEQAVDGHADRLAARDELIRALRALPARRRRVVVLRYLSGLSEQEVAGDLGISVGTVKSTAARGLAQLRTLLEAAPTGPVAVRTMETKR
jgi:RNA polymerase sigma-70 factor (sigma-E family)